MKWAKISLDTSREFVHPLALVFREAGAGSVLEEVSGEDSFAGVRLTAYVVCDDMFETVLSRLQAHINAFRLLGIRLPSEKLETEIIEEEDWANSWKRFYKPFRLGCFVIKPSWEPYSAEEDEKIIELDPGMAFGTGQHATTALCLGAVEDYVRPGDTVIDAGTGSGILSVAAHLMGASEIHAFDCDTVAVKTANQNFEAHGMDVRAERAFDAGHISVQADVVLANIIASVILYMADSLAEKTKPGGVLAASGIIMSRDREVFDALTARGFEMLEKRTQKEWVCYIMKKKLSQGALNDDR